MKPTKRSVTRHLDKIFAEIVRSKYRCVKCHKVQNLNTAHIYSRSNRSVRWDFKNALCLCAGCHIFWAHKNPIEFTEFVKDYLGEYEYNELRIRANTIKKWTLDEMLVLLEEFKKVKNKLK